MWQFAEATRGLADGCQALGIPVTGGNVSLYNQTGDTAILPTPVVAVLGVIDDVARRTPSGFVAEGQQIYLLGTTRDELVRLGVGARRARPPRRPAAGGRPGAPSRSSRTSWSTPRATGSSTPRTTSPTAASRRRWSSRACATTSAPGSGCPTTSTRSSRCSASRPAGRSSRCRARRRSGSPTCAPPAASRTRASGSPTAPVPTRCSTCRASSACRWPSSGPPGPRPSPPPSAEPGPAVEPGVPVSRGAGAAAGELAPERRRLGVNRPAPGCGGQGCRLEQRQSVGVTTPVWARPWSRW